jgi:hypothetical protein
MAKLAALAKIMAVRGAWVLRCFGAQHCIEHAVRR